ncbi:permease [Gorillibacterium sp. CAU 1737]|uniref:permease n=1 Tax=Gorillibacterium sp. CAU 1737 TaxID=3140362 RepID=UPI003261B741
MGTWNFRRSVPLSLFILASLAIFMLGRNHLEHAAGLILPMLMRMKPLFLGIVLEALPFLLIGVMVSAIVQVFVSEDTLRRLLPKNPVAAIAAACVLCILFPLCECGIVPIVRRLLAKGMPLYIGLVFLLVGPIVNPVVFAATSTAFHLDPGIAWTRMGLGLFAGCGIAAVVLVMGIGSPLKFSRAQLQGVSPRESERASDPTPRMGQKLSQAVTHAGHETFEMGFYLLLGCFVAALLQASIPAAAFAGIGDRLLPSSLLMMGLAYVLSLCSTSDAFVAASFAGLLPKGSLLGFLVLGPMLDFKGTLMLLSVFRGRFVLLLSGLVVLFVLAGVLLVEHGAAIFR